MQQFYDILFLVYKKRKIYIENIYYKNTNYFVVIAINFLDLWM